MAKGAIWMVTFKLLDRSLGLLSTIVLARLLVPADYGIIAMAMSLIAILELITTFSFDIPLIQNPNATKHHFDTAWTFNVIFAVSVAAILVVLAAPTARFYSDPRLVAVIAALALGSLVQGFENVGIVEFRKSMQFNREFQFMFGKRLAAFVVTVTLALVLRDYWALVAGMLTARIFGVALSYYLHPYRPSFSLRAHADLFGFSKWLFLNNALFFVNNRSADFVIGKVAGARALGLYGMGYEISNLPTTELIAPINRAVFPGYAQTATDLSGLRRAYLSVISMILMLALPSAAGIAAIAPLMVPVILGPKWLQAIPVIKILAFYGAAMAVQTNMASVFLALAKPRVLTILAAANAAALLPALLVLTFSCGRDRSGLGILGHRARARPRQLLRAVPRPRATCTGVSSRPMAPVARNVSDVGND